MKMLDTQLLPLWIYRPDATLQDWILFIAIILGYIIAISVIVWCGLVLLRAFIRWLIK